MFHVNLQVPTYLAPVLETEESARADLFVAGPRIPSQVASFELLQPFFFFGRDFECRTSSIFAFLLPLYSFSCSFYILWWESRRVKAIGGGST